MRQNQQEIRKRVSNTVNEAIRERQLKFLLVARWISQIKLLRGVIGLIRKYTIKRNIRLFKMMSFFSIRRIQRMFRRAIMRSRQRVFIGKLIEQDRKISLVESLQFIKLKHVFTFALGSSAYNDSLGKFKPAICNIWQTRATSILSNFLVDHLTNMLFKRKLQKCFEQVLKI